MRTRVFAVRVLVVVGKQLIDALAPPTGMACGPDCVYILHVQTRTNA